jgi:hypothetical protein
MTSLFFCFLCAIVSAARRPSKIPKLNDWFKKLRPTDKKLKKWRCVVSSVEQHREIYN